jgi:hypothetical protein
MMLGFVMVGLSHFNPVTLLTNWPMWCMALGGAALVYISNHEEGRS